MQRRSSVAPILPLAQPPRDYRKTGNEINSFVPDPAQGCKLLRPKARSCPRTGGGEHRARMPRGPARSKRVPTL